MESKFLPFLFAALLSGVSEKSTAQYCAPSYFFGCQLMTGDQIESFFTAGINSTMINDMNTGCSPGDWKVDTGMTVTYNPGGSYNATVTSGTTDDNVQVFIDFNDDMSFGAGETVGGLNGVGISILNFSIAIPSGAQAGAHRMRIVLTGDGQYPGIVPCVTQQDLYGAGEVHDYTAIITGTTCDTPTGLTASSITFDGATVSWTAVTGATGYQYALNTNPVPPVSGTGTLLTSYPASGLMSGTTYYFHLRTACGNQFSSWITISFTTSACPTPANINQSAVTATSATISWTAVTGAQGYQYAATTSSTAPPGGTYTTSTSGPVSGLMANTFYHAWVRTVCGQADTSAWASDTFSTMPVSVVNISNDNFSLQAYPNPAKNTLTIAALGKEHGSATIEITDMTGKPLSSYSLESAELSINISQLSTGMYLVRYIDSKRRQTIKINKE